MTTESAAVTTPATWLEELVERIRLPWLQVTAAVGLMLILLLVGAAYLDGVLVRHPNGYAWWKAVWYDVDDATFVIYVLLAHHLLRRLRDDAFEAFRSLTPMKDGDSDRIVAETSTLDRLWEWLALGIGATAGLLLNPPWGHFGGWPIEFYLLLSTPLRFGLIGWIIHVLVADLRLLAELHSQPLDIDVFDLAPLEPMARWSLGISLTGIGALVLSALLNPVPDEFLSEEIITYPVLTLFTVLVFFLTMRSTHRVIVEAKEKKLRLVRHNLSVMFQQLQEQGEIGQVNIWLAYEKRIQEAHEWPFTVGIIRNLLVSTLLPTAIFIGRMLVLEVARRLLFSR
jgi:hypothetical protein